MYRNYIAVSFLALIVLLLFKDIPGFDFTWDDRVNISGNPLLAGTEFNSFLRLWQSPYESLYIPATYTVWFLLVMLSSLRPGADLSVSLSPAFFHTASMITHLLNALLVYMILTLVLSTDKEARGKVTFAAAAGALLFAVHPVQVEPVCWSTGMKDLLSGFFSLSALLLFLNFLIRSQSVTDRKTGYGAEYACSVFSPCYIGASILFVMALLAKPNAVVLPLVTFFLALPVSKHGPLKILKYLVPWVLLAIPFAYITKNLQPDSSLTYIPSLVLRPFIASDTVTFYILKILFPLNLAIDYGRTPEYITAQHWFYLSSLLPVTLILFFINGIKNRYYLFSFLIFITGILPVSGLVPFAFQFFSTVADRYLYLSMLGPAIALSIFFIRRPVKYFPVCLVIIFLCFAFLTRDQKNIWKNDVVLFEHAGRVNPGSSLVRYNLGVTFAGMGDFKNAAKSFADAIRLQPDFPDAMNALGEAWLRLRKPDRAESIFLKLLLKTPEFEKALNNMGMIQRMLGKNDEALSYFRKAVSVKPDYAKAHNNLGVQLATSGNTEEAIHHFKLAIKYNPGYLNASNNLKLILSQTGRDR